jgi:exodeoxyribonuclease VII small subunit
MTKEKISYNAAIAEIESILQEIEGGTLGVDDLDKKVRRVTDLLKICRDRLYNTETQIKKILEEEGTESKESSVG